MIKLPRRGVPVDELRCKVCNKLAKEQPNDMNECSEAQCPFPKKEKESEP